MVAYTIINGTNAALAVGGVTTAAYTIETGVTLTQANLEIVASADGVAVMQDAASAAEKAAVANLLIGGSGAAPGTSYKIVNASTAITDVNAAGDDVPAYGTVTATLTAAELAAALTTTTLIVKDSVNQENRRKLAKVLEQGQLSGAKT